MRYNNCFNIKIDNNLTDEYIFMIIHKLFIMGFGSTSSEFPVVSTHHGNDINDYNDLMCNDKYLNFENFISSTDSAMYCKELHDHRKKGLECLFDLDFLLEDENNDLLADKLKFKFKFDIINSSILAAAGNISFRYGMSTTRFSGNLIADDEYEGNLITFVGGEKTYIQLEDKNKYKNILIHGYDSDLEVFISKLCSSFPYVSYNFTWSMFMKGMMNSFKLNDYDGQISFAKEISSETSKKVYASIDLGVDRESYSIDNLTYDNFKKEKLVFSKKYGIISEIEKFKLKTKNEFSIIGSKEGKSKKKERYFLQAALNEDKEIRAELKNWVYDQAKEYNLNVDANILCAYKQGYSWIEEVIIPKLKNTGAKKVCVLFKPFLPGGRTEWIEEKGGSIPTYNNFEKKGENSWYDIPIRFLQELYPIDDVIERELNINKDNVKFMSNGFNDNSTYEIKAYNFDDSLILDEKYIVETYERPYLDKMKNMGCVHPATGYLNISNNSENIHHSRITTDTDEIWNILQSDVLENVDMYLKNKFKDGKIEFDKPLFNKLEFDIEISEPDYKIGVREDVISSLDALHEDIYFVLSDYFKNYGLINYGKPFDAPGLILPKIKKAKGNPKFEVKLFNQEYESVYYEVDGDRFFIKDKLNSEPEAYIDKISYKRGELEYSIQLENVNKKIAESYFHLLGKCELQMNEKLNFNGNIKFGEEIIHFKETETIKNSREKDIEIINNINFKEGEVIGYSYYIEIMKQLSKISSIKVYEIGRSYQGRIIYAVDFLSDKESGYCSKLKQITYNPSELIDCRHHANEVSSTNAAFRIIKEIVTSQTASHYIDNLNLSIIPVENVDGTALHYELQKINPNWKLHVARFDSLGKEFFYDIFEENTIHTEAKAFRRMFETWLPDLIVDNHGVPSHEWEQPYSGYTSPSFKGFWLPRSIIYGYFWPPDDDKFKDNEILCKKIQDSVSMKISEDKELLNLNLEWAERFEKYAHNWMPELFPANYYNNMIFYWIRRKYAPDQKYLSHKYPWLNTAYFTSEVADETAQGDYLELCTKTHFLHNMEIIKLMTETVSHFKCEFDLSSQNLIINATRHRPLTV